MNCKPGDIAYITHPSHLGRLVSVMYRAPSGKFTLPDGFLAFYNLRYSAWVCESLGSLFDASVSDRGAITTRKARYVVIADNFLRPIRGDELPDESEPIEETA